MFLWPCSLAVPVLAGWVYAFVVLCPGTPEGLNGSGSGFKASQKTGQRLKVSSNRLEEAGNRTCDPWFTRHSAYPNMYKVCNFAADFTITSIIYVTKTLKGHKL